MNKLIDISDEDCEGSTIDVQAYDYVSGTNIEYFEGNYNEFFHRFLLPNKPCIVRNVTKNWKSSRYWTKNGAPNTDYLFKSYGNTNTFNRILARVLLPALYTFFSF